MTCVNSPGAIHRANREAEAAAAGQQVSRLDALGARGARQWMRRLLQAWQLWTVYRVAKSRKAARADRHWHNVLGQALLLVLAQEAKTHAQQLRHGRVKVERVKLASCFKVCRNSDTFSAAMQHGEERGYSCVKQALTSSCVALRAAIFCRRGCSCTVCTTCTSATSLQGQSSTGTGTHSLCASCSGGSPHCRTCGAAVWRWTCCRPGTSRLCAGLGCERQRHSCQSRTGALLLVRGVYLVYQVQDSLLHVSWPGKPTPHLATHFPTLNACRLLILGTFMRHVQARQQSAAAALQVIQSRKRRLLLSWHVTQLRLARNRRVVLAYQASRLAQTRRVVFQQWYLLAGVSARRRQAEQVTAEQVGGAKVLGGGAICTSSLRTAS